MTNILKTNYTIYRLFDYDTGHYVGPEFSCIKEFFKFHHTANVIPHCRGDWQYVEKLKPTNIVSIPDFNWRTRRIYFKTIEYPLRVDGIFLGRYAIKNEYGETFDGPDELYRMAKREGLRLFPRSSRPDYKWNDPIIFPPKNNVNKYKPETWSWYFRGVKTANEIRQNNGHVNEYGESIVRGRRRKSNIPTSWDDLPNSRRHTRRSWKHNTKRRHQWMEK